MIKVTGQKFGANLSLRAPEAASLTSDAPQPVAGKVTVVSDSEATVALPTSINFGLFTLSFLQDGVEQNVTLLSNGGKTDYPVVTMGAEKVCAGDKFYDEAGVLRTGTKDCAAVSLPSCSQDGAVDCKATKDFVAADISGLAARVALGSTVAGVIGTAALENHADCSADGANGCVATSTYPAASLSGFTSGDIRTGITIAGVAGVLSGAPSSCAADGSTGCIANSTFTAANVTGLASKVLSGNTVGGVSGNVTLPAVNKVYSSITYGVGGTGLSGTLTLPLASNVKTGSGGYGDPSAALTPSYSPDFPAVGNVLSSDTVDGTPGTLTLPVGSNVYTVNGVYGVSGTSITPTLSDCASDGSLGCVTVTGYPSAKLANFSASNLQSGTTVAGIVGSALISSSYTTDGQQNCAVSGVFKAANVTGISTWDLRSGLSLGGVTGALKTNCRNTVNSTYFNHDTIGTLGTAGDTTGTAADHWDTVDDYQGWSSTQVTGWSSDTYCDSTTFTDVTTTDAGSTTVACGTGSTCIYKDNISNLRVTGILAAGGNTTTTTPATFTWPVAVQTCAASTYGGYAAGSWRLPTQKELWSLYEHGIVSLNSANFATLANLRSYYWSSSSASASTANAWTVYLTNGTTTNFDKTSVRYAVCIR